MPEIKNNFLAGKMNKSLDDRLLPQGEYRDALNIQVTKNDDGGDSNVGVIHNIKGNSLAYDNTLGLSSSYKVIGSFFDDKNNTIYWFVTNGITSHRIYKWSEGDSAPTIIVSGSYLKFSKENKITGINILENFLFWTDNINQPRKIDLNKANGSYYDSEVKISVAKYAPYKCPQITDARLEPTIRSKRIEEEFVRFAYRYKFTDKTYSIISPFTPIAFKMASNKIVANASPYETGPTLLNSANSTEVNIMVNGVNEITMTIPLPTESNGTKEDYEIEKVEILYKESDSSAIRVIAVENIQDSNTTGSIEYVYKSTNFLSTISEDQLTRAFDNVPTRALAQEIAGNRLIYGNYSTKKALPDIDFDVFYSPKTSGITNPVLANQSLKQRRSYEVGIVLSDMFGRTSPVITGNNPTIYVDAKDQNFNNTGFDGDSIKISFNSISNESLYGVNEPTGWYSYKVVVKQLEQEYYNVYTPGVWNYHGRNSYFLLHGDNINKVPRDTTNYSETSKFSPSSERVYPKVLNLRADYASDHSYVNVGSSIYDVSDIGNLEDHGLTSIDNTYEPTKNHLIGKVEVKMGTPQELMRSGGDFAVLETEPFESSLDIYYETPTSGLISDLVEALTYDVLTDFSVSLDSLTTDAGEFSEASYIGDRVCQLIPLNAHGEEIPGQAITFEITSQDTADQYGVQYNYQELRWEIYLKNGFAATSASNVYSINLAATGLGAPSAISKQITITETNVAPTLISSKYNLTFDVQTENPGVIPTLDNLIFKLYGSNGSNSVGKNQSGLLFELTYLENTTDHAGTDDRTEYSPYLDIAQNKDFDSQGNLIDRPGVALIYYKTPFTNNGDFGDEFLLKFAAKEFADSNNVTSEEINVVITLANGTVDSVSNSLYYAPASEFSNAYYACQEPVTSVKWSLVNRYYIGDDPFVVEEGAVVPGRMYNDVQISIPASSGWYKRTDTRVVGYYYISGNEPESFAGWWYDTPAYCDGLTLASAEASMTGTPPEESTPPADDNPFENPEKETDQIP